MKKVKVLCVLMCMLLVITSISFGVSAKEIELAHSGEAPVYYIETYEQLRAHALHAQADCRYILNDDIVQEDNLNDLEIIISAGSSFNLDLNGYGIKRATQGNDCTLFRIKSDGKMTIKDTSEAETGYCTFSEGYADYNKAVFLNEGGELEIFNGYYEILSPYEQGNCSVVRATSGYTNIYDGTFDSSTAWGGDTIFVGHDAYLYDTPHVNIFGGDFYGKYQSIEASSFGNYLNYGKEYPDGALHPTVYVLGGNFYICNGGNNGEHASFAYCNNGWGRVIVAEGTVLAKCLNSSDQRFLSGVSKKLVSETIDDYTGGYYEVTAPPVIMSEGLDYYYRLVGMCNKAVVNSYDESVHKIFKEQFDEVEERIDTILVSETEAESPLIKLENRTKDHKYINWYMVEESSYYGEETEWIHLGDCQNVSQWKLNERPQEAKNYIIRCVVTKSDLTTYEDMVRICYETLKKEPESTIVSEVDVIDVDTPLEGETPDLDTFCTTQGCNVSRVQWYDVTEGRGVLMSENDTFVAGRVYRVDVLVKAEGNHTFLMEDGYNEAIGYINGVKAIAYGSHDERELELGLVFPACEENPNKVTNSTNSTSSPEPVINGLSGDADCDSKVNVKDATAIQKHIAGLSTLSENGVIFADVDTNTNVNIKDATAIQKWIAGIETGYPIGEPKTI